MDRPADERRGSPPGMGGMKPIGLVIAMVVVAVLLGLPLATVAGFYLFASVYAIVVGSDFGSNTVNVGAFLTGLVLTVAASLAVSAGVVALIGRALSPRRRHA